MRSNKKGFTIVELVIVIAVIAILAAVLIPTIAGLVKKANLSSDKVAVRNMNTALATKANLDDIDAVIDALAEAGFNSKKALIPVTAEHKFLWNGKEIVLVDKSGAVVFPEGATVTNGTDLGECVKYINVVTSDADALAAAVDAGSKDIKLDDDVADSDAIVVPAGVDVTIDLGGNTLATGARNPDDHQYALNVYGTVTLTNGTIDARGVEVRGGGKLIIGEGVTINAIDDNGGAAVYLYAGAEVEINGGKFESKAAKSELFGGSVILNNGGKLTINGGEFVSTVNGPYVVNHQGGETIINGGTFSAVRGVVGVHVSGSVTINGGTFTKTDLNNNAGYEAYCDGNATLVINSGTFTNDIYYGTITDNRE